MPIRFHKYTHILKNAHNQDSLSHTHTHTRTKTHVHTHTFKELVTVQPAEVLGAKAVLTE